MIMPDLRFHFNCYALCIIEREEGYDSRASLCEGLFLSHAGALLASKGLEARRRDAWEAYRTRCHMDPYSWPYEPQEYQIVPLASCVFESLSHLEDAICAAAVLQAAGVGAETGRA